MDQEGDIRLRLRRRGKHGDGWPGFDRDGTLRRRSDRRIADGTTSWPMLPGATAAERFCARWGRTFKKRPQKRKTLKQAGCKENSGKPC